MKFREKVKDDVEVILNGLDRVAEKRTNRSNENTQDFLSSLFNEIKIELGVS